MCCIMSGVSDSFVVTGVTDPISLFLFDCLLTISMQRMFATNKNNMKSNQLIEPKYKYCYIK